MIHIWIPRRSGATRSRLGQRHSSSNGNRSMTIRKRIDSSCGTVRIADSVLGEWSTWNRAAFLIGWRASSSTDRVGRGSFPLSVPPPNKSHSRAMMADYWRGKAPLSMQLPFYLNLKSFFMHFIDTITRELIRVNYR